MAVAADYISRIADGLDCVESAIQGVGNAASLRSVCLHGNLISRCSGTSSLTSLTDLNLSANRIESLKDLAPLLALRNLNLASNRLENVDGLPRLPSLSRLNLAHNHISSLSGLSIVEGLKLQAVDVRSNRLVNIQELAVFATMPELRSLNVAGGVSPNGISNLPALQMAVALALPQVSLFRSDDAVVQLPRAASAFPTSVASRACRLRS